MSKLSLCAGELPDIESISAASILRPLALLCLRDRHLASAAVVAFSNAIASAQGRRGELHAWSTMPCDCSRS